MALLQTLSALCTRSYWDQCFPASLPNVTEKDMLPGSQQGRVFVVTGGNSGLGLELIKMLYPTGATIYMAGRSRTRAEEAIRQIITGENEGDHHAPTRLKYLHLDLNDLTTIKKSAAELASSETRLDILWNNAGIAGAPAGTSTEQNIEVHLGVNCVAPLLFVQELLPLLRKTAARTPKDSVRVVWTSSLSMEVFSPAGGIDFSLIDAGATQVPTREYAMSKTGNWFLAMELARRCGNDGIISVAENPGQLDTDVWRYQSQFVMRFYRQTLYDRKYGAYTMLYAGFSDGINMKNNGAYIMPWGRILDTKTWPRQDIVAAIEAGQARQFWEWCEDQWKAYVH